MWSNLSRFLDTREWGVGKVTRWLVFEKGRHGRAVLVEMFARIRVFGNTTLTTAILTAVTTLITGVTTTNSCNNTKSGVTTTNSTNSCNDTNINCNSSINSWNNSCNDTPIPGRYLADTLTN